MQIKRFEAGDMTDALRMVKREFGDDAVILSAKEIRPGGLFSAFRKKLVEITAASDYSPDDESHATNDFTSQLAAQLDTESENDRVSLSAPPKPFVPVTAYSEAPEDREPPAETTSMVKRSPARQTADISQTADPSQTAPKPIAVDRVAGDEQSENIDKKSLTAIPFYRDLSRSKTIALVGSHGSGKSSAIAKLASHLMVTEKKSVAVISLDRFRIGANSTLEKVSQIMTIPFIVVRDTEQLQTALEMQADVDVVLIDTPGGGQADTAIMGNVREFLETAEPDEIHLVVNATVRQAVLSVSKELFTPLGIDHLLLTHMDELGTDDIVWDVMNTLGLPSAFYTDGIDLFDHLQETTIDGLDRFCKPASPKRQRVTDFPTQKITALNENKTDRMVTDDVHFVANRNSELFHHPDCRSVKRINAENITAFGSIEQAMEEGFKPCRACCNIETIRKSASGGLGSRRMSAI